jgi:hypothetical protein
MDDRHTMNPVPRPDEVAFHRPLRLAVTGLILVGATLAAIAAILSVTHHALTQLPAFAVVTLVLSADAVLVWRKNRWAVLVTLVGLAGQAAAVAGTIVELAQGIADVKVHQLQRLGFNPTAGVIVNLIYSSMGFAVFGWFAFRWFTAHRHER